LAAIDAALPGYHIDEGTGLITEVSARHVEGRGGGLARVNSRLRLVEGTALPHEEIESHSGMHVPGSIAAILPTRRSWWTPRAGWPRACRRILH
jgi:hypothetical protein